MKRNFNERMRRARERTGLSLEDASVKFRQYLPSDGYRGRSYSTLARYEKNVPEEKADPVIIWAVARAYGIKPEELSPMWANYLRDLVGHQRWCIADPLMSAA